jgi:arylformamidase
MESFRQIYDISLLLDRRTTVYPGDPPVVRTTASALAAGDACELSYLAMSSHAGTHLDAPAHFIDGGKTIDRFPVEAFILPARVIGVPGTDAVRPADLAAVDPKPGEALLLKTDNSTQGRGPSGVFNPDHVYLSGEAAAWCVTRRLALVGIDALSIDAFRDDRFEAHRCLLSAGLLILENIDLATVPQGRFTLICLPLKIAGGEASPVRAVLLS